jgi:hypothetical protein
LYLEAEKGTGVVTQGAEVAPEIDIDDEEVVEIVGGTEIDPEVGIEIGGEAGIEAETEIVRIETERETEIETEIEKDLRKKILERKNLGRERRKWM